MMELTLKTSQRAQMLDITDLIESHLPAGFSGVVLAYVPHTTAGITINEGADPAVRSDILRRLEELVPRSGGYRHAEGNSDAHIKSSLMGNSALVPVQAGKLSVGSWQAVFFCEFDGPRNRKLIVELMKE